MADPFPELTRVVEFVTASLRPRDAVGTPGVIPSTLAADLAAVVATCEALREFIIALYEEGRLDPEYESEARGLLGYTPPYSGVRPPTPAPATETEER